MKTPRSIAQSSATSAILGKIEVEAIERANTIFIKIGEWSENESISIVIQALRCRAKHIWKVPICMKSNNPLSEKSEYAHNCI